ncbi:hypothetical protein [Streptomyces aureus]
MTCPAYCRTRAVEHTTEWLCGAWEIGELAVRPTAHGKVITAG